MKHIKTSVLALLCAFAGMTNIALAADKTVTYTFSAERDIYSNRGTLTFTPSSTGFGYSTGTKTATIQDLSNTTGFGVQLDDGLQLSYRRDAGQMAFVGYNSFWLNRQSDENTYLTLSSSHYYVKHVRLATADGDALYGMAAPWTDANTQMDTDVDMVTQTDGLTFYRAFNAHITATQTFAQLTVTYGDAPRPYAITFNEVEGLTTPNPATYSVTTADFQVTAPTRTGYDLGNVTYTDAAHPSPTAVTLPMTISRGDAVTRKAIAFNATWTPITYTLRLHHNDGTDAYTDMTLTYDEAQNIQTVSRTGYIFDGWSTTQDGSVAYTDGQEVLNLTAENGAIIDLYAQWTLITNWSHVNTALKTDGTLVTLPGDITAGDGDSYLLVPSGVTATLDLNGHTINRNLTSSGGTGGSAIRVEGSLTINDSQGGGCITGGYGFDGGGVYVSRNASFTMNGGTISGNTAVGNGGGGVMVYSDATCTLNGVTIRSNESLTNHGGGVYVQSSSSCTMTSVTITGNTASRYGGGVCAAGGTTVSGLCTITGNTVGGQNNNVYAGSRLYIGGTLDPATRIGINVNRSNQQIVVTNGLNGKGSLDNFFCDVEGDQLSLNDDGEAVMTLPPVMVDIYTSSPYLAGFRVTDAEGRECENNGSYYYALSGTTVHVHVTPRDGYGISDVTYEVSLNTTPATFVSAEQREFVYTFVVPYTTKVLRVNVNTFVLKYYLDIVDNKDIRPTIANYHGHSVDFAYLRARTLYRDGDWNTLCLPFNVSDLSDTCLEGATLMELGNSSGCDTGFDATTGTLTLDFVPADSIKAGHAYLVKWETTGDPIEDSWFENVTVVDENPENQKVFSQDGSVTFVGSYSPVTFTGGDRSVLYLGSNNNLYFPAADRTMGSFRAYFRLNLNAASEVKAFVLNFNEESADGINSLTPDPSPRRGEEWYTLDGRKLNGKPSKGGIYIHNGRKEILK